MQKATVRLVNNPHPERSDHLHPLHSHPSLAYLFSFLLTNYLTVYALDCKKCPIFC